MDILWFAQIVSLALPAAWLTLGLRDNILHPSQNEVLTAQVLTMERMEQDFPDDFAMIKHRRITSLRWQKAVFRLIVIAEAVAVAVLWGGVVAMIVTAFWGAWTEVARDIALLGALLFTSIWAMFTVVGNYFAYWFLP